MRALHANGMRESGHDTYCVKTGLILQTRGSGREPANRPTNQNIPTLEPHVSDLKLASAAFPSPNLQGKDSLLFLSESPKKLLP